MFCSKVHQILYTWTRAKLRGGEKRNTWQEINEITNGDEFGKPSDVDWVCFGTLKDALWCFIWFLCLVKVNKINENITKKSVICKAQTLRRSPVSVSGRLAQMWRLTLHPVNLTGTHKTVEPQDAHQALHAGRSFEIFSHLFHDTLRWRHVCTKEI